jgi:hypothetical protein
VTKNVLTLKIYGMVGGIDISFAIGFTLTIIIKQLGLFTIPIIVYTDSYSLYECLVKLGIIKKKRLIIDIIVIVLAEYQAVNTGRRGKPLGQNVYGTGRTTGWK